MLARVPASTLTGTKTGANRLVIVRCRLQYLVNATTSAGRATVVARSGAVDAFPLCAFGWIAADVSRAVAEIDVVLFEAVNKPLDRGPVEELHDASLYLYEAFALKAREQSADCFEFQPQIAADFLS